MSSGWQTIISDAGVFTELVCKLGVKDVQIDELYSIDAQSLKALAPVHAVIFLFKYGKIDRESAVQGKALDGEYDKSYQDKGIFYAHQTIQNACATQAVLNALLNKSTEIKIGQELSNIRNFVAGFDPDMCGDTISNSETIRTVHNSFSAPKFIDSDESRQTHVDERDNGLFHYITYLNINNHIYELDGLQRYPIKHDYLGSPDEFYDKLPAVLHRRIAKYSSEIRFSLLAITNDKLNYYRNIGDESAYQHELQKRQMWEKHNRWRRHDYTKLTVELIKNISASMSDDEWHRLLDDAKAETKKRMDARR